jgi:putative DNA primase/helicase
LVDPNDRAHNPNEGHVIRPWAIDDIAKNDKGKWILIHQRIGEVLLSPESPLDIVTFRSTGSEDKRIVVTYDRGKDSGIWQLDGKERIRETINEIVSVCDDDVKEQLKPKIMDDTLKWVQWNSYVDRADFASTPGKIPLLNGVYDLATNTLESHKQENHFLYQVPIKYDAKATCPKIDEFMGQVFGEDRKKLAYEIAGNMLCANAEDRPNKWQRAFMLLGAGDNGKSTYLILVIMLLGEGNVSNQSLQALIENRFAVNSLEHKLANIGSDIGDRGLRDPGKFKELTGGDRLTGEAKYKDLYEFRNRAILAFSANILPKSYDDSNAFHKRWIIMPFNNTFTGDKKDADILSKIATPEELSGFFNAAIAAYREMTMREVFTSEGESVEKKRELYTKLSDSVQCFMDDCLVYEPDAMILRTALYEAFQEYAKTHGYWKSIDRKKFYHDIRSKDSERIQDTQARDTEGIPRRVFKGIRLLAGLVSPVSAVSPDLPSLLYTKST